MQAIVMEPGKMLFYVSESGRHSRSVKVAKVGRKWAHIGEHASTRWKVEVRKVEGVYLTVTRDIVSDGWGTIGKLYLSEEEYENERRRRRHMLYLLTTLRRDFDCMGIAKCDARQVTARDLEAVLDKLGVAHNFEAHCKEQGWD